MDSQTKRTLKIFSLVMIVYLTMTLVFRFLAPAIHGVAVTQSVRSTVEISTCVPTLMILIGLLSAKSETLSIGRFLGSGFVLSLLVSGMMAIVLPV